MAAVASACANCGGEFVALRVDKLTCSEKCKKALQRGRLAPRDVLLEESARMGIVERVDGSWSLTKQAELEFGAALRGLPELIRDDVRVAA
jgi:hypothetical protein